MKFDKRYKFYKEDVESIGSFVDNLRAQPKVHCIVNEVAAAMAANALLAVGAKPSMTSDPSEVSSFTESADSLSINLGMLTNNKRRAIRIAANCAEQKRIPWVLDTTLIDRSKERLKFCEELLDHHPAVIRGNHAEIASLCKHFDKDKTEFCRAHNVVLVSTGEVDWVDSIKRGSRLRGTGHPWMAQVSGMGCTLSALIAAMLTAFDDPFQASQNTLILYGTNGKRAAEQAKGPGTFFVSFMDCLSEQ